MAFGDSNQKQKPGMTERREQPYMKLPTGDRVLRILDSEETSYWRYFLPVNVGGVQRGRSIVVAMDNPIKQYMNNLGPDHPGFRKVEFRMMLNVVDRTDVVRWTDGTTIYADTNGVFRNPETNAVLVNPAVQPNNRVFILDFGRQLMDYFMAYHNRVRDRNNMARLLPVQELDLRITTMGSGFDTKRVVSPDMNDHVLPEEILHGPRYDLKKLATPMPNSAIQQLLDGADYNEVITALGWERVQPLW